MRTVRWVVAASALVVAAGCGSAESATVTTPPGGAEAWIVYQSPHGIQQVLPTGFNTRPVLGGASTASAQHVDFSRDGQWMAFNVEDDDGTTDIWTSTWDGKDPVLAVDCVAPCRDMDDPAWSPDSTKLAFYRVDNVNGHNPGSALQILDVASGKVETAYRTEGAEYLWGPRWSPDGKSVVVGITRYLDDGNDTEEVTGNGIAVIRLDPLPATLTMLRPLEDYATYPDWHPTKDLILFQQGGKDPFSVEEPPTNVFTMRPDGSDVRQITDQKEDDPSLWMATFRMDGDGFLATRIPGGDGEITVVAVAEDGSISEISQSNDPRPGAHPRQRVPIG